MSVLHSVTVALLTTSSLSLYYSRRERMWEKFKRHKTTSRESWQTSISRLKECVDHPWWLNVSSTREIIKIVKILRFNDDGDRSEIHRFDILHTIVTFSFSRATRIARFFDTHRRALISLDFLDQSLSRNRVGVKSRHQRIVLWIRSMQ